MSSVHDTLMRSIGAPALMQQHASPDSMIFAAPPDRPPGQQPDVWHGIVGRLETDRADGVAVGTREIREQRETVTLEINTSDAPVLKETKVVIMKFGLEPFSIESIDRGEVLTLLRLYRNKPEAMGRARSRQGG